MILLRIYEKKSNPKKLKIKSFLAAKAARMTKIKSVLGA
jgi:hypothetical protein